MKNKSSNEKVTIFIIIIFILIMVILLVLYFLGIIGGKAPSVDIVLNKDRMITYSKDKWKQVLPKDYEKYDWDKFDVFEEGKKKGNYSLYITDNKFYLFEEKDKERNSITTTEESLYLGGRIKSKFIEFDKEELTDKDNNYIHSVLLKEGVSNSDLNNYLRGYKVTYDFDNDDNKEELFVISNMFAYSVNSNAYSLIFVKDNNKTTFIYKNVVKAKNRYSMCSATLLGLIKIEDSNDVNIITKCGYYSYSNNNEYGVYKNSDNKYELLLYIK